MPAHQIIDKKMDDLNKKSDRLASYADTFTRPPAKVIRLNAYNPVADGKAVIYKTLFAETRAICERGLFANTRAVLNKKDGAKLFANTRAIFERGLFANTRASIKDWFEARSSSNRMKF